MLIGARYVIVCLLLEKERHGWRQGEGPGVKDRVITRDRASGDGGHDFVGLLQR
jgi:hypothetical protein